MSDTFIRLAGLSLGADEAELARQLGVTRGCLRHWKRKGAPRYARLALAALTAGLTADGAVAERAQAVRPRQPVKH